MFASGTSTRASRQQCGAARPGTPFFVSSISWSYYYRFFFFLNCSSLLLWHDMNHSFLNLSWCCPDVVGLVVTSVACLSLNLVREPVAAHDPDAFCSGIMAGTESVPMEECVVNWDSRWFKYVPAILKIFEVCSVFQFPHSCLSQRHWWSADHSTSTQRAEVLTVFTGLTPDAFGRKRENFCLLCRRD